MKVKIKRGDLLGGLQQVQGVVERRSTMPILANVLIEASSAPGVSGGEGTVSLFATDLEIGIKGNVACQVSEPGGITLAARKLYEILKELPEGEIELSSQEKNWATLAAGKSQFRLAGLPREDFPAMPSVEQETMIPVGGTILAEAIKKTLFAAGENDARYILNGLLFNIVGHSDGKRLLRLVSTDGHRLAFIEKTLEGPVPGKGEGKEEIAAVVGRKAVAEMGRLMEEEQGEPTIGFSRAQMVFREGDAVMIARLMEGTYPNYRQVIPKESKVKVLAAQEALTGAIRRVAILAREKGNTIKIALQPGLLVLSSSDPEMGEAREEMPVRYKGEELTTGFNARYLLDVLGVLDGEEVEMGFNDPLSPCVIREAGKEDYLCVIMPMRV